MTPHAIYDAKGNIIVTGWSSNEMAPLILDSPDLGQKVFRGLVTHEDLIDPATGHLLQGAKGKPPSAWHTWDKNALVWVVNLPAAKVGTKAKVDAERARRRRENVTYNGWQLQADDRSYEAVSTKLDALSNRPVTAGAPAAAALFWRDASNVNQTFANVAAFKSFLSGFLSAIDDRNAGIDSWAFAKKDSIDAAADWTALSAIDPTS